MSDSSPTDVDYTQEVRFAIVMYGGISLAIYINGVAQELLHMVRATARHPTKNIALLSAAPSELDASGVSNTLSGSERVYRKLGQMLSRGNQTQQVPEGSGQPTIRTRFVVDILSGSSAGGINAVFLAKALANNQPLQNLQKLWVEEADMRILLNDRGSLESTELKLQDAPKSLLNSQRIYWELLNALEGMETAPKSDGDSDNAETSSLVEELELFVTATDMEGQIISLQLADRMVKERRHRKVFHFAYSSEKDPITSQPTNDFIRENNPFLAFAARTTSAHPAAFDPMTLAEIDDVLERHPNYSDQNEIRSDYHGWQKFYEEYLQQPDSISDKSSEEAKKLRAALVSQFTSRPFNDGGVLDNQPFSHTIDTLPTHHSDLPTVRKLLYIEPAPENPPTLPIEPPPDFVENAWLSLSTLPRYEPIREHLQRVLERNHLVERVEHITRGMEKDIEQSGRPLVFTTEKFVRTDLAGMIAERGYGWASYQRLRVGEVTDELVLLITRNLGFNEASDECRSIRYIVRHWRMQHYFPYPPKESTDRQIAGEVPEAAKTAGQQAAQASEAFTETRFLMDFDLPWRLRRLRFVMSKIDDLACFDQNGEDTLRAALEGDERNVAYPKNADARNDRHRLRELLRQIKASFHDSYKTLRLKRRQLWSSPAGTKAEIKSELKDAIAKLSVIREALDSGARKPELLSSELAKLIDQERVLGVRDALINLDVRSDELTVLLGRLTNEQREEELEAIVVSRKTALQDLETKLRVLLGEWIATSRETCEAGLARNDSSSPADEIAIRHAVAFYFDYFDFYDMIAHPILYATNAGDELDRIEVFRVSPADADRLISETKTRKRKLAGTKLANFGAFFKREFRTNDILWGRLDGAERIITALLPDTDDETERNELIDEAHCEILKETLGVEDDSQLLSILKTLSEPTAQTPDPKLTVISPAADQNISNVVTDARVKFALETFLLKQTPREHFRDQFLENYETDRQFNSQDMVSDAARATKVFGKMLEGYAKLHQIDNKRVVWVTRLAQIFWGLVEVAIPGSIANLVFRHWLKLLYLFEFLVVLLGTLLNQTVQRFGLLVFAITLAIHIAEMIVSDALRGKRRLINLLIALLAIGLTVMVIVGFLFVFGLFGVDPIWQTVLKIKTWESGPATWNSTLLNISLLILIVLFFLGSLRADLIGWWRGRHEKQIDVFEPIAILPLTLEARQNVRPPNQIFFWRKRLPVVPFTLSAKPTREWKQIFKTEWKSVPGDVTATVKGTKLLLVCTIAIIEKSFNRLKEVVSATNARHGANIEEARAEAAAHRPQVTSAVNDPEGGAEIKVILDKLNYS